MERFLFFVVLFGVCASGMAAQNADTSVPATTIGQQRIVTRDALLRYVDVQENAIRNAQAYHLDKHALARLYLILGGAYRDLCIYGKAEAAMRHSIELLRDEPEDQLASAYESLALLHDIMGDSHQAEKNYLDELRIRQSIGDSAGISLAWKDLAYHYLLECKYAKSLYYSTKAMALLGSNPNVPVKERIAVHQTFAYALCANHHCGEAIPLFRDSLNTAKEIFGPDSFEAGITEYALGYGEWKTGNVENAGHDMQIGLERMKNQMGWGHALYLNAIEQYVQFLRHSGQMKAAEDAEREVQITQSVVDVRTLVTH
jgi:tetratricopeptide (TPR) repeat protein